MYRLTPLRRKKVKPILEKHRDELYASGRTCVADIEMALRDCLNTGWREVKSIVTALAKEERYKYLAAFFMESIEGMERVPSEFKPVLSKLYGIRRFSDAERGERRKAFWSQMKAQDDQGNR